MHRQHHPGPPAHLRPGPFPELGISGAALATGIGQVLTLQSIWPPTGSFPLPVRLRRSCLKPDGPLIRKLYAVGVPAILNLALPSLLISVLNGLLSVYSQSYVTVLGNLLQNAIDELRQSDTPVKEISLGLFIDERYTILTVTDTGRGMSEEVRAHLFERSFSTRGAQRGTGLFLVKELVDKYRGTVEVDTERGEGTSITVSFRAWTEGAEDACTE